MYDSFINISYLFIIYNSKNQYNFINFVTQNIYFTNSMTENDVIKQHKILIRIDMTYTT